MVNVQSMSPTTDLNNNELTDDVEFEVVAVEPVKNLLQNLNPEDLIRGSTPDGIEQRCLELCQEYLGGCWNKVDGIEHVTVKRISGGFTNQLYHVKLNEDNSSADEPNEVAIKLYQEKQIKNYHHGDSERLNDIVILTIASQVGIGPEVYGIFNDGFIQEFIKHEQFRIKHQSNPKLVTDLAHLLAKIHSLKVPVRKDDGWLLRTIRGWIQYGYEHCQFRQLVKKFNLEELKHVDLLDELDELEQLIIETNSPSVFSHNDFRGSNILVTEHNQKLLTVDMEYSTYTPRAFDIAVFLSEWGKEEYDYGNQQMPEEEAIENFVRLYIEGCDKIDSSYSTKEENSFQKILRETKIFLLLNIMFFIGVAIKQDEVIIEALPFNPFIKMTYVLNYYKMYVQTKQQLINDGTIRI